MPHGKEGWWHKMDKTGIEAGLFAKLIIIKGLKGLRRLGNTMR